ncbi:MAG TPA: ABC transporter ATP-binding protein, partial [Candidatus Poseidoniales archaeon]|nr:ABC transporter ATP-binding protein [Candidatus Poseidoniales archaeon]
GRARGGILAVLKVKNSTVSFGGKKILDAMNLNVSEGEVVALLGPSGCGKTTLLRFIAGLEKGSAGEVHIDGKDVTNLPPEKRGVGMVFQNLALFPHLDVAGNLSFGMSQPNSEKISEMLETVGLKDFEKRRIDRLSGGEGQRVALARSLLAEPTVLLLDEPLASLDEDLKTALAEDVRKILKEGGITAIHVTHDRQVAAIISDRIVEMDAIQPGED